MKTYDTYPHGVTLIELLIVISLIGIVSSIGFSSIFSFNQNQTFTNTSNEVYAQILLAKSRAQTQVVTTPTPPSGYPVCSPLQGYQIIFNSSDYGVVPVCSATFTAYPNVKKKTLPSGFTFTPTKTLTFLVLTGTVKEIASGGSQIIQLKDGSGHTKNYKIYYDGRIEVY